MKPDGILTITFDDVQAAVCLDGFDAPAAHARMSPMPRGVRAFAHESPPRKAGVLLLIYPESDGLHLILTRRTDTVRGHSGQISFPGGSVDPQDASVTDTALRETCEELGLCNQPIAVIGQLSPVYIPPTNFYVVPTVAVLLAPPVFDPNPDEVAEVFTFPLWALLDERTKNEDYREIQGYRVRIPFYNVRGHQVWGATAVMLSELEHRLRAVLAPVTSDE